MNNVIGKAYSTVYSLKTNLIYVYIIICMFRYCSEQGQYTDKKM